MKIALIQSNAASDKNKNISRACEHVQKAMEQKARWVLLPEMFSFRGDLMDPKALAEVPETIPGPTTEIFRDIASKNRIHILLGSLLERSAEGKPFNSSILISADGKLTKYHKIHLFDAIVDDKIIHEADFFSAGSQIQTACIGDFHVGLSICYDLRFPGLYQNYSHRGANLLLVPSCFTQTTGKAHWESLLRARAIENLSYVIAPNQVGTDARGISAYGHSLVVDPWGEIIAQGSEDKEEIIYAEIDLNKVKEARRKLPGVIK